MSTIEKTTDYSMFKKHPNNRPILDAALKKLVLSIKAQNMLEYRPMLVDAELRVIDGQHRLKAAEMLAVPIYYQIDRTATDENILLLNSNTRPWTTDEYVNYYISKGNVDYLKMKEYADHKKVGISTLLKMTGHSGRRNKSIMSGGIKFFSPEEKMYLDELFDKKDQVLALLERILLTDQKILKSLYFNQALLSFLKNDQVDFEVFKKKLYLKAEAVRQCVNVYSYYCMFRDIYNWKNHNPLE